MYDRLKIVTPGLLTTVQDLGRYGYQQYGMTPAGAMDTFALQVGNLLLGNAAGEAALEVNFLGPAIEVLEETIIAVTGGDLSPVVDGEPLPMWEVVCLKKGQVLNFGEIKTGCRAYIAVAGGIDVPVVMGSKSTYLRGKIGGFNGRQVLAGDIVRSGNPPAVAWNRLGKRIPQELIPRYSGKACLRVIMGPQDDYFTDAALETFLNSTYTVSIKSDRMGYRLEGPKLQHKKSADIISDGIPLGAVQVPGDGRPIILLVDRQTTGGYTKIATVISADIPALAQLKPGDTVSFKKISVESAHEIYRQQRALLNRFGKSF